MELYILDSGNGNYHMEKENYILPMALFMKVYLLMGYPKYKAD